MRLGIVIGQVVSTMRSATVPTATWLLVEELDGAANKTGKTGIAADLLGAGEGELVVMISGSNARLALAGEGSVDLAIVGIVDCITSGNSEIYNKHRSPKPHREDSAPGEKS